MIIALGDIYAQIPHREAVRELMTATQAQVRQQPGCLSYTFTETLDDPGHFMVVQQWRDQAALDEHFGTQAFADYQARIADRLVRTSDLRLHLVGETFRAIDSSVLSMSHDD